MPTGASYSRIDDDLEQGRRTNNKKTALFFGAGGLAVVLMTCFVVVCVTFQRVSPSEMNSKLSDVHSDVQLLKDNNNNNGDDAAAVELKRVAKYMTSAMDTTVDPCDDFYQYACGGWIDETELPKEKARLVRSFDSVAKENEKVLKEILEDPTGSWPVIGVYHQACKSLDTEEGRAEKVVSLLNEKLLSQMDGMTTVDSLLMFSGFMHRLGAPSLFSFGSETDAKNPTKVLAQLSQGGLTLPTIEIYTTDCDESLEIREQYVKYITAVLKTFDSTGKLSDAEAEKRAADIIAFETTLAKNSWTPAEMRDPEKTYNVKTFEELKKFTPKLSWTKFFDGARNPYSGEQVEAAYPERVNVAVLSFFTALEETLDTQEAKKETGVWRDYLTLAAAVGFNVAMPKNLRDENFALFGKKIGGMEEDVDRTKACIDATDGAVGELLGRYFVQQKFSPKAKEIALQMVNDIEAAFEEALPSVEWLDDKTRDAAREKLGQVTNKIGFPDKWESYPGLTISEDPLQNLMLANEFAFAKMLDGLDGPTDKGAWEMTPQTVNAYYNPGGNEMVFPAGIMQQPFFDEVWPKALNFGSIGAVIGHELTHGFDDQGSQYDGTGELRQWWEPEVVKKFQDRTACVRDLYSSYCLKTQDGGQMCLDGANTLGENIADCGGVKKSYQAYTKWLAANEEKEKPFLPGLDLKQTFFLQYAQTWCAKSSEAQDRLRIATDPHSLSKFRVIGPLSNFDGFAEAFNCKVGSVMNPEKKCSVW